MRYLICLLALATLPLWGCSVEEIGGPDGVRGERDGSNTYPGQVDFTEPDNHEEPRGS